MIPIAKRRRIDRSVGQVAASAASRLNITWIVGAALIAFAVAGSIWVARSGLADSSRGNPAEAVTRESPLWGITNWPVVFSSIFVVVSLVMAVVFVRLSLRERRMHHLLIVFLCVLGLSLLDPPANWVTFTVLDPQFLHYPTSWRWMSLSPLVEPIVNPPGYTMYFLMVALSAGFLSRRLLARARPGTWVTAHPRFTYFGIGFLTGIAWDVPTELFMIRAHMYVYSEAWGPTLPAGHGRFPIVWGFFTWFAIGTVTVLLYRDDRGRSLAHDLADRLPGRPRASTARTVAAGTVFLWLLYLVPLGLFGAIRVSGLTHPNLPKGWPYAEAKVYDPYGKLRQAGIPGPYYR